MGNSCLIDWEELDWSGFMVLIIGLVRYRCLFSHCWFRTCGLMSLMSVNGLRKNLRCFGVLRVWGVKIGVRFKWVRVGCWALISSWSMKAYRWIHLGRVVTVVDVVLLPVISADLNAEYWFQLYYVLQHDVLCVRCKWSQDRCWSLRHSFAMTSYHWTHQTPVLVITVGFQLLLLDSSEQEYLIETGSVVEVLITRVISLGDVFLLNFMSVLCVHGDGLDSSDGFVAWLLWGSMGDRWIMVSCSSWISSFSMKPYRWIDQDPALMNLSVVILLPGLYIALICIIHLQPTFDQLNTLPFLNNVHEAQSQQPECVPWEGTSINIDVKDKLLLPSWWQSHPHTNPLNVICLH